MARIGFSGAGARPKTFREAVLLSFPNTGVSGKSPLETLLEQCRSGNDDVAEFFPWSLSPTMRVRSKSSLGKAQILVGQFERSRGLIKDSIWINERNSQVVMAVTHQSAEGLVALSTLDFKRPRKGLIDMAEGDYFTLIGAQWEEPRA